MDEKKLDRKIDRLLERYEARDVEGVNRIWAGLSEEERAAFNGRLQERIKRQQEEHARIEAASAEMLRVLGMTPEEMEEKIREADKGKIGFRPRAGRAKKK